MNNTIFNNNWSDDIQRIMNNLSTQVKSFNLFGEQLSHFATHCNAPGATLQNWQQQLEKCFGGLSSFQSGEDNLSTLLQHMLGPWQQLPMDTIQRTLSSASLMPGDLFQDLKYSGIQAAEKYLAVPGIGYTRQSQESFLKGVRLWGRYQQALNEFLHENAKIGSTALNQLQEKITKLGQAGKTITSLREIYDLWVDINESAYAKFVFSERYSKLYGALVNSLMEYKLHSQGIVDEVLGAMNIPSRRGVDTLKKRQQELRRELLASQKNLKDHREAIQSLQRDLATLKSKLKQSAPKAKATPSAKKTVRKKTASSRGKRSENQLPVTPKKK